MTLGGKATLLFIGGSARSGSTVLDRMLGQLDGFFSTGELRNIWTNGYQNNELCGCGAPFKECLFWIAVTGEAFGGFQRVGADKIRAIQRSTERLRRRLPQVLTRRQSPVYSRSDDFYLESLTRLYQAISEVSGSRVVIDSSKDPLYGFTLRRLPNLSLRAIHLVRDSRAVAYSQQKRRLRPEVTSQRVYMHRLNPAKSALAWNLTNSVMELLRGFVPVKRVRYEDFALHPAEMLHALSATPNDRLLSASFIRNGKAWLGVNHTVAGNPMRFQVGKVQIAADVQWERQMDKRDRRLVTALTLPLLVRYGYRTRAGVTDSRAGASSS